MQESDQQAQQKPSESSPVATAALAQADAHSVPAASEGDVIEGPMPLDVSTANTLAHLAHNFRASQTASEAKAPEQPSQGPAPNFQVVFGPENHAPVARPDQAILFHANHLREQFGHLFPEQLPTPKKERASQPWAQEELDEFLSRARMWEQAVEKASGGHMRVWFSENTPGIPEVRTRCDTCGDMVRTRARFFVRDAVFDHLTSSKHTSNVALGRGPQAAAPAGMMVMGPQVNPDDAPGIPIVATPVPAPSIGSHDGPCSAICLGFGFRDNLVRGPDYRNKLTQPQQGQLLFVIEPEFRGHRCVCHGGQVADDGSAFGRGDYQCSGTVLNPTGVCDGCDRASKLHVARQRRYYRCNRNDVCGRRATARKRKHEGPEPVRTRRTNAPAGSEAARRHAPAYVLSSSKSRDAEATAAAGPEMGPNAAGEAGDVVVGQGEGQAGTGAEAGAEAGSGAGAGATSEAVAEVAMETGPMIGPVGPPEGSQEVKQ